MTDELRDLCSAALDGTLTPEQSARLEELVLTDPAARRYFTEQLHHHASLAWAAGDPRMLAGEGEPPAEPARREPHPAGSRRFAWAGWAVAACLLVGLGVGALTFLRPQPVAPTGPREFARLTETNGCKWDGGSLPTEAGARLGSGRLRLSEGVARIAFDNGAELRLEGPADLELRAADRCVLHDGRLVARCPESAHGFVVETPTASLLDLGTEFGVSVADGKTADVQVFEGRVDATHTATGRVEKLLTGRGMRFTPEQTAALDSRAEDPRPTAPTPTLKPGQRLVTITTASGRGKDGYVEGKHNLPHRSDVLILVKATHPDKADYIRKGYVGFDLAPLAGYRVVAAQLSFAQAPTGMGFASEVPDATFVVHGVTDEFLDGWDAEGLRWGNAPANAAGAGVNPAKTVKLGQFKIAQGVQAGMWSVGGRAVADFLNQDTNGIATFALVRTTPGSGRNDYVHGFAGKDHPTLPPPTLKLVVVKK